MHLLAKQVVISYHFIMLKRKIVQYLIDWKDNKNKECLLIMGARQIGKTYIVREFAHQFYENFIEINFELQPQLKTAFDGNLDVPELIRQITLLVPEIEFVPGKTLLFLDEIQSCPQARTSLKFWAEDNRFDVVASGSLLGINYKEVSSFPVGYERQIEMYSLDFEEFLWANGYSSDSISELKKYFDIPQKIPESIHTAMLKHLREYIAVGGMPAVVNAFIETNNFNKVHDEQQKILNTYLNDIAKYAPAADKPKARNCYLSIPQQLAKENTKFQFSVVEKKGTSRKYANSLDYLRDANLVRYCYNVSFPVFPLVSYVKLEQFRLYVNDIGLLVSMYGYEMKAAIVNDTLKGPSKGGIYENLMADFLLKKGQKLFYYQKDDNSCEIEFLLEKNAGVVPVEVKASRGKTTSLNKILESSDISVGYKFTSGNCGVDGKKITLPLYLALFL